MTVRGQVLTAFAVAFWCLMVLGIGIDLAESAWEWAAVLSIGIVTPVVLLLAANRLVGTRSLPSARDKEKELLDTLAERGELTPVAAAIWTSLTPDEATKMLEGLANKGFLKFEVDDGIQTYVIREQDRRMVPGESPAHEVAEPEPEVEEPRVSANLSENPLAERPVESLEEPLSARELEVLRLLASGRSNSEVARDLFLAVGTVKNHTSNAYRKLDAKNRAEALSRARELDLL